MNKTEIIINELGATTEIVINGTHVEGFVSDYHVEHQAGNLPVLHLDIPVMHLTLKGRMIPELPEIFKPFYEVKSNVK